MGFHGGVLGIVQGGSGQIRHIGHLAEYAVSAKAKIL